MEKNNQNFKKFVLSGGPCSGKTTLVNFFKSKGYDVINEVAREVLFNEKTSTGEISLDKKDFLLRQFFICSLQLEKEKTYNPEKDFVFLDRGFLDGIAYLRLKSLKSEILEFYAKHYEYDKIFLLDRFPFESDSERIEASESEAEKIQNELLNVYSEFGYTPIKVPIMPIKERAEFILKHV